MDNDYKLPETLKIGPYLFSVSEDHEIYGKGFCGIGDINQCSIKVASELPDQKKHSCLWYEALTTIFFNAGITKEYERILHVLGGAIILLLRENPCMRVSPDEYGKGTDTFPTELKIGPFVYRVVTDGDIHHEEKNGQNDEYFLKIKISSDMASQKQHVVLWHEAIHSMLTVAGIEKTNEKQFA